MTAAGAGGGETDEQGQIAHETLRVLREARRGSLPVVTVSWARSVTGAIAAADGARTSLSGPESMRLTHRLRAMHDGILVGIQTVLSDDPLLSVRLIEGAQPQPVILDSHLRFPLAAKLLTRTDRKPWVFYREGAEAGVASGAALARREALAAAGARLFPVPGGDGGLDLRRVLDRLLAEGIRSLMVEGGARVLGSFISQGLASQAVITVSPTVVQGFEGPRMPDTGHSLRERYGTDEVVWIDFRGRSSGRFARE
jgi:3,4-dihydroxy 2-butanone 4-phosphate synthase/GTP cyclohydrolase II